MDLNYARKKAMEFHNILLPYCKKIASAGAIRYGAKGKEVHAIELVVIPDKWHLEKFFLDNALKLPDVETMYSEKKAGIPATLRWTRREHQCRYKGYPVNLFIATEKNFGWVHIFRSGPPAFVRTLLSKLDKLYDGYIEDGTMYDRRGNPLFSPTEESVFELLEMPYKELKDRR